MNINSIMPYSTSGGYSAPKKTNYQPKINNLEKDTVSFTANFGRMMPKDKSGSVIFQMLRRFRLRNMPERFLNEYQSKEYLNNALIENYDEIKDLIGIYGYKPKIHMDNLTYSKDHFVTTYNFARNLTNEGGFKLTEKERDNLLEAALLHDTGKALIPPEILKKPGRFTPEEREIMDLHSEFSYLLLKDSDLSAETLEAIRMHHRQNESKSFITKLLAYFDTLSALKEKRCYKPSKTGEEVIEIQKQIAQGGGLEKKIVKKGSYIMKPRNKQ